MKEILIRFVVGGAFVSAFAALGDVLKPKSFAGLFGAAPAVALATLTLTVAAKGTSYVATESRSMTAGAIGFFVYASCFSWLLMHRRQQALFVATAAIPIWFAVAFGIWQVWLR
jgi:hypothetical protein